MRVSSLVTASAFASSALGFPFLSGNTSPEQLKRSLDELRQAEVEKRQLSGLTGAAGGLVNTVGGLLGSVAAAVDLDNKRPEPGYVYQDPKPSDSRGPCPGLNLLANYGYLPRDGYVNFGQVVDATARGFNMATDLSSLLAAFAVLANGNVTTESFYLGTGPGNIGGLNRHSTVEADISPNREDFYNGCGDNHHLSSNKFKQHVGFAASSPSKQFDLGVMAQQWAANSRFTQENNPYIYFFPFPSIVSLGAFPFYPNFFSNGTYRAGGVANYESISSIIGAQLDKSTGEYTYVPERWPENWYRRATPYGAVQAVADILTAIYPANPVPMAFGQLGTDNLNANTILCTIYQGLNSVTPLSLAGDLQNAAEAATWAARKLAPFIAPSVLGCPASTLSANEQGFLFPNSNRPGGPNTPPPGVFKNTGNNVYGKTYFTKAPSKTPNCS